MKRHIKHKSIFKEKLQRFLETIIKYVSTPNGQWSIKGFIDVYKNIYTISTDTKIVSKILEIHLFPKILEFAERNNYKIVLADHQNYYPDISFIDKKMTPLNLLLISRLPIEIPTIVIYAMVLLLVRTVNTL